MGFWNLFKFSTRMFKARTSRTLLTILGTSVGIGAILFLVALGFGIQRTLLETITTSDSLLTLDVYPGESAESISQEQAAAIKANPQVDYISPVFQDSGQLKYSGAVAEVKIMAVDEKFLNLEGLKVIEGEKLSDNNLGGIVIASALAKVFEKTTAEMRGQGVRLVLNQRSGSGEEVSGDYQISGVVDQKDTIVYINKNSISQAFPSLAYGRLKVKCLSSKVIDSVREQIAGNGFIVSAVTDTINQVEKTFQVVRIILGLFGAIALIVSAIGMFNTMVVTLMERTEEIGIMKSIGASDYDILWMFVFESTIMGFLGGIVGIFLGWTVGTAANLLFNLLASRLGGYAVSLFYFPLWFLAAILVIATLVGFITGLIPARKASATDPLEALRYK